MHKPNQCASHNQKHHTTRTAADKAKQREQKYLIKITKKKVHTDNIEMYSQTRDLKTFKNNGKTLKKSSFLKLLKSRIVKLT